MGVRVVDRVTSGQVCDELPLNMVVISTAVDVSESSADSGRSTVNSLPALGPLARRGR